MVSINIRVDGRRRGFAREDSEYMLEEAAAAVEDAAKNNAPVKTGNLANSIETSHLTSRSATVSTDCEYAIFQEAGTSRGVPATHFMQDAMDSIRAQYSGDLVFEYSED